MDVLPAYVKRDKGPIPLRHIVFRAIGSSFDLAKRYFYPYMFHNFK
jgi:hypothetical protein